jgi:hypothetical protein
MTLGAVRLAILGVRAETGCTGQFDYFPKGGIQNLWCHRPLDFAFRALEADAKVPVFVSGPHGRETLKLDDANDFGHYDPAFVRWLKDTVVPTRDDEFRQRSQPMFDSAATSLVTTFLRVRNKIRAERPCFDREAAAYSAALATHTLPRDYYERWFYFLNPQFCAHEAAAAQTRKPRAKHSSLLPEPELAWYSPRGFDGGGDGNVTKTVTGFWIRRSLDGTFEAFSELLDKVVTAYAPDLAKEDTPQLTVPPH